VEDFPGSGKIRVLVADLDEKSEIHRDEYWRNLEDQLSNGGYYLGKGKTDVKDENCDLTDNVSTSDQVKWDDFTVSGCVVDAYVSGNREAQNGIATKRRSKGVICIGKGSGVGNSGVINDGPSNGTCQGVLNGSEEALAKANGLC
jgi:hypothetical protein